MKQKWCIIVLVAARRTQQMVSVVPLPHDFFKDVLGTNAGSGLYNVYDTQTRHVLHHRRVAGQGDPTAVAAGGEAKLLLAHPKELSEDGRAKVHASGTSNRLRPAVSRVHDAMALAGHRRRRRRGAGSFGFFIG